MPTVYTTRPASSEYAPYYSRYVDRVPAGDVIAQLETQGNDTLRLLERLTDEDARFRYAPDKWSIKQMIGHMIDTERVFVHRAFCFSRNEAQPLPGMDQDDYVKAAHFDQQPWEDLLAEYRTVRTATVCFFKGLSDAMMMRTGTASDVQFTVRALVYITAGHERHHLHILQERYMRTLNVDR